MSSISRRTDGKYRGRYRDPSGREHARHFARKVDAQRWLDEATASIVTGQYVDPKAGRETFKQYAERWRAVQVHRPATKSHVERMLRLHVYPVLGDWPLASILPSDVQAWVAGMQLAPSTVHVVHGIVAGIFNAAVGDRRIATSPCGRTRLPKVEPKRVVPLSTTAVEALIAAVPESSRALIVLAAGTGLRQGEVLGLTLDRVDFLRRTITVDRQIVSLGTTDPYLGPTKTAASVRTIPLPQVVAEALAEHVRVYGATEVEVEDQTRAKPGPVTVPLLFVDSQGRPWRRGLFGSRVWLPAVEAADGVPAGTGFHQLRHFYASLLIRHGESVKTVQSMLGHASASETLDTYSHLWPDSDERTREAVDGVLLAGPADSMRTAEA